MSREGDSPAAEKQEPGALALLRAVGEFAAPQRGRILLAILAGLFFAGANTGFYYLLRPAISHIEENARLGTGLIALFLAFYLVKGATYFLSEYLAIAAIQDMIVTVRQRVVAGALRGSRGPVSHGEETGTFFEDINQMCGIIKLFTASLIKDSLTLLGLLVVLAILSPGLSAGVFAVYLMAALPAFLLGKRMRRVAKRGRQINANLVARALEFFTFRRETGALYGELAALPAFGRAMLADARNQKQVSMLDRATPAVMEVTGALGFLLLIYFFGADIFQHLALSGSITFAAASLALYQPLKNLGSFHVGLQRALASSRRIVPYLQPASFSAAWPEAFDEIEAQIHACPAGGKTVLQEIRLRIQPGVRMAIVGRNGAGKTTLLQCIAGLQAFQGRLLMDHRPIDGETAFLRPDWMIFAGTAPALFDETLLDNVRLGQPFSEKEVNAALQGVGLPARLARTGLGLASQMGETGDRLSRGMKQRLVLARMLLFKPKVLLLDEMFASMPQREALMLFHRFAAALPGCAMLLSTHIPALAAHCDVVAFLEGGRLREYGPHEVLLAQAAAYRLFWGEHKRVWQPVRPAEA